MKQRDVFKVVVEGDCTLTADALRSAVIKVISERDEEAERYGIGIAGISVEVWRIA